MKGRRSLADEKITCIKWKTKEDEDRSEEHTVKTEWGAPGWQAKKEKQLQLNM